MFRVGILTVSDRSYRGEREDISGPAIEETLNGQGGYIIVQRGTVPDEEAVIASWLIEWCASCDLILTTGGTGFAPRDVTPEATASCIERLAPGLSEAMRQDGLKKTPFAMLSRGVSGIRGSTLIVNLPGSPRAVREGLSVVLPVLEHGLRLLRGEDGMH
ncbi:MAG: MogA/MoaB family molybdenum cofactor biosynthesis protein [Armatimonadetes bacterium]|nr:MogA/MoaB family molybdenum cofactor biosynthesis protein [Armatimonadota bacterium]